MIDTFKFSLNCFIIKNYFLIDGSDSNNQIQAKKRYPKPLAFHTWRIIEIKEYHNGKGSSS